MSTFLIPLTPVAQSFTIPIGGISYILTFKWNDSPDAGWEMDITDETSNDSIVAGIPLITGVDLLIGLEYLGIPGQLLVFTDGDDLAVPTFDNLGGDSNVYLITQ